MKKKTMLTLGVCALAMGAVVGAVSAHQAARVKADDTFTLSLTLTVTNFDGATMQKPQLVYKAAGATTPSYYNSFVADGTDPTKFTGTIAGIAGGTFTCHVATWGNANPWPEYDFYGAADGVDYSFEVTGDGTLTISGELVAAASKGVGSFEYKAEEISIPDPDHPNGWYLVGGMNGWAANDDWYTDGYDDNNVAKWIGVTLAKDVTFAFVYSNYDNLEWGTAKRYADYGGGGAGELFVNANDGDKNFKCTTAGTYDIYMTNAYKLYFEVHTEPSTSETSVASSEAVSEEASEATSVAPTFADGWYMVGSMNEWKQNAAYYTDGYEEEKNVAMWLEVTLAKDATFAFAFSTADKLDWDQAKRFADRGATGGARDIFVDAEDGDHNFKCTVAGTYDIYMGLDYKLYFEAHGGETSSDSSEATSEAESSVAPTYADGWYMVGSMNEWKQDAAYYTDGYEEEKNVAMWLEVTLDKDATFAFAFSTADKLDWDQAKRFADRGATGGARDIFVDAEDGDHNFKCTVAGTYDIYMGLDYKLYFEVHTEPSTSETSAESQASEVSVTSATPVLDGYVYISTAHNATSTTLYTWDGKGGENAPWPGVELKDGENGVEVTNWTNFNDQGGLWRIPLANFMAGGFKVTINYLDGETPKQYETQDLVAANGVYVAPGAAETDAVIGAQAKVAFDVQAAIGATEHRSVCEVAKAKAAELVGEYDALTNRDVLDVATYWTYDVDYKDLTPETDPAKNAFFGELLVELRATAESGASSAWNVTSVANNTMFVVTLLVVGGGLVGAVALYLISKKRRLQK